MNNDEKKSLEEVIRVNHPKYICAVLTMAFGAAGFILTLMGMMDVGTAMMFTCAGMIAAGFGLFFAK